MEAFNHLSRSITANSCANQLDTAIYGSFAPAQPSKTAESSPFGADRFSVAFAGLCSFEQASQHASAIVSLAELMQTGS
jgi:hypothetical protein